MHRFLKIAMSVAFVAGMLSCTRSRRPAPVTHWRTDATAAVRGSRVLLLPVDTRVAILGKCDARKKEKIHDGAQRTGAVIASLLPDYLKSRGYDATHLMLWSGRGRDAENQEITFLPPQNTAAMVYSLAYFSRRIENTQLKHVIDPADFKQLATYADYTLYTASWSVVDFQKKKESVAKTILYTGAIVLAVAVIAVSILAVVGGKDGADIVAKGLEAGGRILVYAGRGFARFFTRVPARAVLNGLSRAAMHTARVSARVASRVVMDGSVRIEIPLEQVEAAPMENLPSASEPLEPEEELSPEEQRRLQELEWMTNPYMGVYQGISSLQPPENLPGYQMVLVLVNNHTGRVVWDAHLYIPQDAPQGNLQVQLETLFRSLPPAPPSRLSTPYLQ